MEIADLERVQKIIGDLEKKYSDGGFIFRGATEEYSADPAGDGVNSTLYRWAVKELGGKHVFDEPNFRLAHLEKAILEKVEKILSQNMDNRRILTSLQHYGGKTSLIDFTRSLPIALFFACNDHMGEDHMGENEDGKNGELIVMQSNTLYKNKEIKYPGIHNPPGAPFVPISAYPQGYVELVEPAKTDDNKQRVLFQNSVFVRPASGYIEKDENAKNGNIAEGKYAVEIIDKKDKKDIMAYLDKYHGIKPETIYNDLVGFIANPNNYESFDFCIQMGKSLGKTYQFQEALSYYSKALRHPNSPVQRSSVNFDMGVIFNVPGAHQIAEAVFTITIGSNPNHYQAYFERGNARVALKNYRDAHADFRVALELARKRGAPSDEIEEISISLDRAKKLMEGGKDPKSDDGD